MKMKDEDNLLPVEFMSLTVKELEKRMDFIEAKIVETKEVLDVQKESWKDNIKSVTNEFIENYVI